MNAYLISFGRNSFPRLPGMLSFEIYFGFDELVSQQFAASVVLNS
jgi:hypothetical protein